MTFPRQIKRKLGRAAVAGFKKLPAKPTLRLLFRLDRWLYYLQGQMAVIYGGGVSPKHRLINYHDFFVERVREGEKALDIGCGIGAVAYDVAERSGAYVTGIDVNAGSVAKAQEKFAHPRVEYRVGDVLRELADERFDVVILSNVLEHLPERPSFLRRLQMAVNPSRLLIRVPLFERDWRVPLKKELGVEWRLDPTHETEYTLETFAAEIEGAKLKIVHLEVRWGEIWSECKSATDG
ncbi:MAG: class I SAM-dependent methyltransferase [Anaerolineae bacterium]